MPGRVRGIAGREACLPFSVYFYTSTPEIRILIGSTEEKRNGEGSMSEKGPF